jgi:hypothetical protein
LSLTGLIGADAVWSVSRVNATLRPRDYWTRGLLDQGTSSGCGSMASGRFVLRQPMDQQQFARRSIRQPYFLYYLYDWIRGSASVVDQSTRGSRDFRDDWIRESRSAADPLIRGTNLWVNAEFTSQMPVEWCLERRSSRRVVQNSPPSDPHATLDMIDEAYSRARITRWREVWSSTL